MKKILTIFAVSLAVWSETSAQRELNFSLGWGTEHEFQNRGLNLGLGYHHYIRGNWYLHTHLRYFTASLLNIGTKKATPESSNQERYYNAFFVPLHAGYSIGNSNGFHVNLQTGPTVFYHNYKQATKFFYNTEPGGGLIIDPDKTEYTKTKGLKTAWDAGVSFNMPFRYNYFVGAGVDFSFHRAPQNYTQGYIVLKKRL